MSLTKSECIPGLPVIHNRGFTGILTNKFSIGPISGNDRIEVIRCDGSKYQADLLLISKYKK